MTLECVFSMKRDSIIYLLPKMRCGMDFFTLMERVGGKPPNTKKNVNSQQK